MRVFFATGSHKCAQVFALISSQLVGRQCPCCDVTVMSLHNSRGEQRGRAYATASRNQRSEHTEQSSLNFSSSTGAVVYRQRVLQCTTRQLFHNTVTHIQHTRLGCREQGNTGHFIPHNTSDGIIDIVKNGRYLCNFPPCSKLKYFASLRTKECEDPSGQIYCVCVGLQVVHHVQGAGEYQRAPALIGQFRAAGGGASPSGGQPAAELR